MALSNYSTTFESAIIETNSVLRNTYFLLSMTLLFSALTAFLAMKTQIHMNFWVTLGGMMGLLFLTQALSNSVWGLVTCFAFTGFMGLTLGPTLNMLIAGYNNGSQIILTSLSATGLIFLSLSAYVLNSRKDFSYLGGFIFASVMVAFVAGIAAVVFKLPMLQLFISGAFALISCGYILFTTSQIISGGERNYILATISLYVSIFNLFVSLLQILSFFAGDRK